jgi:hypothetical protein
MKAEQLAIEMLSDELWSADSSNSDSKNIQPFWQRLNDVDPRNLIVHNFLTYPGTYLERFLFLIFPLWKNLTLLQWKEIFERIEGNELAEYHMTIISKRILGIDPGFNSKKDLVITAISAPDIQIYSGSAFVPLMTGKLKEIYVEILNGYGLTLNDLIEINKQLTRPN